MVFLRFEVANGSIHHISGLADLQNHKPSNRKLVIRKAPCMIWKKIRKRKRISMRTAISLLVALFIWPPASLTAHEAAPPMDQVRLSAAAGREVSTDRVVVVVYKEHQAQEQATAANEVNQAVAWAMTQIKDAGLRAQTTTYRSYPIYRKSMMVGWRVLQRLRVETDDGATLASLLGRLQSRLSIQSLEHVLSPEARAAVEESLLEEALGTFQRRADLIARSFGRSGHRIVSISVDTGTTRHPRPTAMARAGSPAGETQMASPVIEGGEQRVQVTVSGTVQMNATK